MGVLFLASSISNKFRAEKIEKNALNSVANQALTFIRERFNFVINNDYWWYIEALVLPVEGPLVLGDFLGKYEYKKSGLSLNQENYLDVLENFEKNNLKTWQDTFKGNKFQLKITLVVIEKVAEDNLTYHSCARHIIHEKGRNLYQEGDFEENNLLSREMVNHILEENWGVKSPF